MEAFVQMSLETYDLLKSNNEYLKRRLKEEQESHSEDVAQAKKEINDLAEKIDQYKKYLLELNCRFLDVENYSLEHYLDIDSWNYGMNYKDDLLNLGLTKQDMDGFIADKYEELVKDKEEALRKIKNHDYDDVELVDDEMSLDSIDNTKNCCKFLKKNIKLRAKQQI